MPIQVKRVYDPASPSDGARILVDRVWPRGLKKEQTHLDGWLKDLAPSTELRKWFNHEPEKWGAFKDRYFHELEQHEEALSELKKQAEDERLTLLFAAKDTQFNNAVALKEYLQQRRSR